MKWSSAGLLVVLVVVGIVILLEKTTPKAVAPSPDKKNVRSSMDITSSAFQNGQPIPKKYSCDGENISPPLGFDGIPTNAKSLALIMDDPDAPMGTFVHWVTWNIPIKTPGFGEGVTPAGAAEGLNSANRRSYTGPCPPDREHRYFFKFYALDAELNLPADTDKAKLEAAIQGHIIEQAQLMGTYDRSK